MTLNKRYASKTMFYYYKKIFIFLFLVMQVRVFSTECSLPTIEGLSEKRDYLESKEYSIYLEDLKERSNKFKKVLLENNKGEDKINSLCLSKDSPKTLIIGGGEHSTLFLSFLYSYTKERISNGGEQIFKDKFLVVDKKPLGTMGAFGNVDLYLNSDRSRNNYPYKIDSNKSLEELNLHNEGLRFFDGKNKKVFTSSQAMRKSLLARQYENKATYLEETIVDRIEIQDDSKIMKVFLKFKGTDDEESIGCIYVDNLILATGFGPPKEIKIAPQKNSSEKTPISINYELLMSLNEKISKSLDQLRDIKEKDMILEKLKDEKKLTRNEFLLAKKIMKTKKVIIVGKGPSSLATLELFLGIKRPSKKGLHNDLLGLKDKKIVWINGIDNKESFKSHVTSFGKASESSDFATRYSTLMESPRLYPSKKELLKIFLKNNSISPVKFEKKKLLSLDNTNTSRPNNYIDEKGKLILTLVSPGNNKKRKTKSYDSETTMVISSVGYQHRQYTKSLITKMFSLKDIHHNDEGRIKPSFFQANPVTIFGNERPVATKIYLYDPKKQQSPNIFVMGPGALHTIAGKNIDKNLNLSISDGLLGHTKITGASLHLTLGSTIAFAGEVFTQLLKQFRRD